LNQTQVLNLNKSKKAGLKLDLDALLQEEESAQNIPKSTKNVSYRVLKEESSS